MAGFCADVWAATAKTRDAIVVEGALHEGQAGRVADEAEPSPTCNAYTS